MKLLNTLIVPDYGSVPGSGVAGQLASVNGVLYLYNANVAAVQSLFTGATPGVLSVNDGVNYEMGMTFRVTVAGNITGIRFYKSVSDTGTHTGRIWTAGGTQLASIAFTGESGSGWQTMNLASPLAVSTGTSYVVSVNLAANRYPYTTGGLSTVVAVNNLTTYTTTNGIYNTTSGSFPATGGTGINYFRDVIFMPSGGSWVAV